MHGTADGGDGRKSDRARSAAFKPLCASLDGFTLHAATRAGGLDAESREALLRYVLRPPIAQERVEQQPDGLVRITLKKAYREREACPRGMGRSRLTWIPSRSSAGSQPACLRHDSARSTMRGCSRRRALGARASARSLQRRGKLGVNPDLHAARIG